ncbi:MAG: GPW/gp25 family protein [Proteobacteria bacterium]|nr:GPW/gp25 family protein [Pseudomonadota bacterium]
MSNPRYRDLDLDFKPHPITKDIITTTNDGAVKRSVRNLVLLNTYEKPFHPEIGSDVRDLLFELATPLTAIRLKHAIQEVIENFEPRARILDISVSNDIDNNAFAVTIVFRVVNEDRVEELSFSLERLR